MDHFALEPIATVEDRDVWRFRVEPDADHHEIEVFGLITRLIVIGDPPACVGFRAFVQREHRATEADVLQHSEMTGIA